MSIGQEVKQGLVTIKRELMAAKTLETLIPIAKHVRDLVNTVEEAKKHLPPIPKPKAPPASQVDTKVDALRKATAVCLKEVEDSVLVMISTLSTLIPPDQMIPLAQEMRTLKDKLLEHNPDAIPKK